MGRRKKHKHNVRKLFSDRKAAFYDALFLTGLDAPHQIENWQRFFLTEERALIQAEIWLEMRLKGRFYRIEDDVDKRLMPLTPYRHPATTPLVKSTSRYHNSAWSDNWEDQYCAAYGGMIGFRSHPEPLIPRPSGVTGSMLVAI